MKYRKKPVVIEAIKFLGPFSIDEMCVEWGDNFIKSHKLSDLGFLSIYTLECHHIATVGDYVIRGVKGEIYPCNPDIFEMTYEKVEPLQHIESPDCWCEPTLIQSIDEEHDAEVWSHKGHEDINQ